jgi:hypothetical protein
MTKVGPYCSHGGPLEELLAHVHCYEEVPEAWIAANAPDGSLEALWVECNHVGVLMNLAALTVDRRTLVGAACACARMVVKHLPPERRAQADAALDTVERWARREAELDEVAAAADATDHTYANAESIAPLVSCAACAVDAAVSAAATVAGHDTRWYDARQSTEAAGHAAGFAAAALDWADPDGSHAKEKLVDAQIASDWCPSLAAVLRAHLPCPTIDQVRRGLEEMVERDAAEGL